MILRSSSLSAVDASPQKDPHGLECNLRKSAVLNDAKLNSYHHVSMPFHKTYPEGSHFLQEISYLNEKLQLLIPTYDGQSAISFDDINDLAVAKEALNLQHQIIEKQHAYIQYIESQQHLLPPVAHLPKSSSVARNSPPSLDFPHRLLAQTGSTDSPRSGRTILPPMILHPIDTTSGATTMIASTYDDSPGNSSQDSSSTTTAISIITANSTLTSNLFSEMLPGDSNHAAKIMANGKQTVPQLGRTHSPPAHPPPTILASASAATTPTFSASRRKALSSLCSSRSKLGSSKRLVVKDSDSEADQPTPDMTRMSSTCPLPAPASFSTPETTPVIPVVAKKTPVLSPPRVIEMTIPTLYIAHDNTLLDKQLTAPNNLQGGTHNNSKKGMQMMVESGVSKEHIVFLLGQLVFNGLWEDVPAHLLPTASVSASANRSQRGAYALILQELTMITVQHLSSLPWRVCPTNSQILELHLLPTQRCSTDKLTIRPIQTADQLLTLFKPCTQRVDVILDPTSSSDASGMWYPYYETSGPVPTPQVGNLNSVPKRKLAPQFRSFGRGYLRLGDDMSAYGTGFLSVDGGHSFLDAAQGHDLLGSGPLATGATLGNSSAPAPRPNNRSSQPGHPNSASKRDKLTDTIRKTVLSQRDDDPNINATAGGSGSGLADRAPSVQSGEDVVKALQQIQQHLLSLSPSAASASSMKWSEKATHLDSITAVLSSLDIFLALPDSPSISTFLSASTHSSASFTLNGLLGTLQHTLAKAVHPHLYIAFAKLFLLLVNVFCPELKRLSLASPKEKDPKFVQAWQGLILEMLKCLKGSNNANGNANGGTLKGNGASAKQSNNNGTTSGTAAGGGYVTLLHDCLFSLHERQVMTWYDYGSILSGIVASSSSSASNPIAPSTTSQKNKKATAAATSSAAATNGAWPVVTLTKVLHWYHLYFSRLLTACVASSHSLRKLSISHASQEELRGCLTQLMTCITRFLDHREELMRQHSLALMIDLIVLEYLYSCHTHNQSMNSLHTVKYFASLLQLTPPQRLLGDYYAATLLPQFEKKFRKPVRQEGGEGPVDAGEAVDEVLVIEKYDLVLKQMLHQLFHPDEELSVVDQSSSMKNGSSSIRQKMRKSLIAQSESAENLANKAEEGVDALKVQHGGMWYECQLLLQTVPSSVEEWYHAIQVIVASPRVFLNITTFLSDMNSAPQPAVTTLTIGQLLRIIMPFTESTSSADQTLPFTSASAEAASVLTEAIQASSFPNLLNHVQTLLTFQSQLLTIRKLIRVKIADEADYKQAKKAMESLYQFVLTLYKHHSFLLPVCATSSGESAMGAMVVLRDESKTHIQTIRQYVQSLP